MDNTEKNRKLIREWINNIWFERFENPKKRYFELWKNYKSETEKGMNCFDVLPYQIGLIGRGIFIVGDTIEECKETYEKCYPNFDWNMAEIEEYKGKIICYD